MPRSVTDHLEDVHPQMLRAELRREAKLDRKDLADRRIVVGQVITRALALLGITKQEAAYRMKYRDQGPVSRWCTGVERPLLDKLLEIDGFEEAYVEAWAERNPRIEVETIVRIPRRA